MLSAIQLMFIFAKTFGYVDWSWWFVLIPTFLWAFLIFVDTLSD